jgi:hypothetical protein
MQCGEGDLAVDGTAALLLTTVLVAEEPGNRIPVGGGGARIFPHHSGPMPGPTQSRVPMGTESPSCR